MERLKKWAMRFVFFVCFLFTVTLAGCGAPLPQAEQAVETTAGAAQALKIQMLNIGQGDSILIRTASQVIMIDTGDVDERERFTALLKKEKITQIDKLIITHPHADHLGGAYVLLKDFSVKKVYDNGQPANTSTYRTYMKWIQKQKIDYEQLWAGKVLDFGGNVKFQVLSPTAQDVKQGEDLNNNSIVGKLTYGGFSMLFTGDSEAEMEKTLLHKYDKETLKSTLLKSPHHGSKTSSNRNYLKAVAPEAALISVGENNDYKHPHAVTLNKYKDMKIKVYRTDQDGTITVTTNGASYEVTKEK